MREPLVTKTCLSAQTFSQKLEQWFSKYLQIFFLYISFLLWHSSPTKSTEKYYRKKKRLHSSWSYTSVEGHLYIAPYFSIDILLIIVGICKSAASLTMAYINVLEIYQSVMSGLRLITLNAFLWCQFYWSEWTHNCYCDVEAWNLFIFSCLVDTWRFWDKTHRYPKLFIYLEPRNHANFQCGYGFLFLMSNSVFVLDIPLWPISLNLVWGILAKPACFLWIVMLLFCKSTP